MTNSRRLICSACAFPEEYGGSGAGILGLTIAIEEVTKYSNVIGLMLLLTRLPTGPIMIAGNEEQKQTYLPGIANGTSRAAFCLSEPGAGSDVAGMRTHATPDPDVEDGFLLNGTKCWISGGMQADWFVVFAKIGDPTLRKHTNIYGFIVDADSPGVTRPRVDDKMGVKGIDTTEIVFENVKVGAATRHRRRISFGHGVAQCDASHRRGEGDRTCRRRAHVRHGVRQTARGLWQDHR